MEDDPRRRFYGLRRKSGRCHSCELDYKQARYCEHLEEKYSERNIAKDYRTCCSCDRVLSWWWFCIFPLTAKEIAEFLAFHDKKQRDLAEQKQTLQLEDGRAQ